MSGPLRRVLSRRERTAWLRLARTAGVGPLTFARLMRRFGDPDEALEALPRLSRGRLTAAPIARAEAELDALERMGASLVASCEPDFPPLLAALAAPPPVVSGIGRWAFAGRRTVAIVGAREASAAGMRIAEDLARALADAGCAVVSGMARGVDAAAHRGALSGGTIAVLAGGLDHPYPPQNLDLFERIGAHGLVLTAAPLGLRARAQDFPRRNHIISGLSLAVVVIEAALRSGSLITARAAAEQGRDVMAVPGSPLDPRSRGANALLKEGAVLVEDAHDVLAALNASPAAPRRPAMLEFALEPAEPDDGLVARLARLLSPVPMTLDQLARAAQASAADTAAALMELELAGRARTLPGGQAMSGSSDPDGA